jgi:hypothetical protein
LAFHGQDPVDAAFGKVGDVATPAMRRVNSHDCVAQGCEAGDLVGVAVDVGAREDDTGVVVTGCQDALAVTSAVREPRNVLPSTAIARFAAGVVVARW